MQNGVWWWFYEREFVTRLVECCLRPSLREENTGPLDEFQRTVEMVLELLSASCLFIVGVAA